MKEEVLCLQCFHLVLVPVAVVVVVPAAVVVAV
jgi:hypothetical protein